MASILRSYLGTKDSAAANEEPNTVRALPASWYNAPEMYELERRAIFSRKWIIITHKARLREPGQWLRYTIAGFDFVVASDRSGNINAFHNVCRHRAYPVVEESKGTAKIFACRYHGWSYGLNGKLAKAPGYQDLDGFDKSQNNLLPIHVRIDSNGFVWINMDAKEQPEVSWEHDFETVDKQERFKSINFDNYDFDHTWEIDAKYNWKIAADNYNECYHCKTTHPDVPSIANLDTYQVFTKDQHIQHDASTTDEQKAAGLQVSSTYYLPNASMTVSPHFFFMQKFLPTSPTTTHVLYEVFRNRNSKEEDYKYINEMYKRIMSEDKALCDRAQQNLNTGVFINGELHPQMEKGPLYFQKMVRETVMEHHKREREAGQEIWPARQNLPSNAIGSQEDIDFCKSLTCSDRRDSLAW